MDKPFDEVIYLSLSPEKQEKVYCIYNIASMLHHNQIDPLTPAEFDDLYDKPLKELELIAEGVAARIMGLP